MDHKFVFEGIGTKWVINLYQLNRGVELKNLEKAILDRVEKFDKDYSRFRQDSWVWKLSQNPGLYHLPPDGKKMFDIYSKLYQATGGKFTPMIGDLISATGYDHLYSFVSKNVSTLKSWDEVLAVKGADIEIFSTALLDFGAAGKGYLVDILTDLLKEYSNSFSINASGDIYAFNCTEKVGLENPFDTSQVVGVVDIKNMSIAGSATNRRVWGKYHHIFDPTTLESTAGVVAVWVIANEAIIADAIATCLFLVGPEDLNEFDFEYLILDSKMEARYSKGFQGALFSVTN